MLRRSSLGSRSCPSAHPVGALSVVNGDSDGTYSEGCLRVTFGKHAGQQRSMLAPAQASLEKWPHLCAPAGHPGDRMALL